MAPKLPPPANTKAVFAGPAWLDTDKVLFAPAVDALTKSYATFGCVYSNGKRGCAIKIGCEDTIVIPERTGRVQRPTLRPSFRDGPKDQTRNLEIIISGFRVRAHARPRMTAGKRKDLPFDERFLDHKMTRLAVIAFGKTTRFEHLAQLFQHGRAAAHHDPIRLDIERRLADIVEQLL